MAEQTTGVFDRIRKRMKFPVTLPCGDTVTIRSMTLGDQIRMKAVEGEARIGFIVGTVLLNDDGSPAYSRNQGETDNDFGMRVSLDCEMDTRALLAIRNAVQKLEQIPKEDVLEGNSDSTSTSS